MVVSYAELPPGLPCDWSTLTVTGDPQHLGMVFRYVISNALGTLRDKGVKVEVQVSVRVEESSGGDKPAMYYACVQVPDDGRGILKVRRVKTI